MEDDAVDELVGERLQGGLKIVSFASRGGQARVYKACVEEFGADVFRAVKFFGAEAGEDLPRLVEIVRKEGRALEKLKDVAGTVRVYSAGTHEVKGRRLPYLVLDWLEGVTLKAWLGSKRDPIGLAGAIELLTLPATALHQAHLRGIVHGDIKPSNLFVVEGEHQPELRVIDFGIAHIRAEAGSSRRGAVPASLEYSPAYSVPEHHDRSFGELGPRTDQYALALLLLEVATGKRPYQSADASFESADEAESTAAFERLRAEITSGEQRPTFARNGIRVPHEVDGIVARALSLYADDRWPTIGEFWAALRRAARADAVSPSAAPSSRPGSTRTGRGVPTNRAFTTTGAHIGGSKPPSESHRCARGAGLASRQSSS